MEVNTSDFAYDAAKGKWLYAYRMIAAPDIHTGSCHDIAVYQGSDQVGNEIFAPPNPPSRARSAIRMFVSA